jgi:hypothetical protein
MLRSNRSPLTRALALASALVLLLGSGADAYGLHRCEHHDARPLPAAAGDHGDAAHAHPGHAGHADHLDAGVPSSDSHHDGGCSCVGDCTGAGAATTVMPVGDVAIASHESAVDRSVVPSDPPLAAHTPHVLPFAQAPPLDR